MTTPVFELLKQLVGTFPQDLKLARELESANAEDDLATKAAVVGFSYNSPTPEWAKGHYDLVRARLIRDYHDEEVAEYGENGENVKLFFGLCIGYLLGLYEQDKIDDETFKLAELQIPGLIMLHLEKITEQTE